MKQLVIFFCIWSALFATSRNEDLKVIVEKSFFDPQCEPVLNMLAMEAIAESNKKIDSEQLVQLLRKSFSDEKSLAKFFEPYKAVFSDEEVRELRKIHENPVWQKYSREGMPIIQAHLQTIRATFKELAASFVEEVKEVIPSQEMFQVTQDNFNEIAESTKPVILDISASWCNPCKMMEPILQELNEKYKDTIQFAKMDFDSQAELAKKYDVTSLPTIVFIKPGQQAPVIKNVGFLPKKEFEAKIAEFLKK